MWRPFTIFYPKLLRTHKLSSFITHQLSGFDKCLGGAYEMRVLYRELLSTAIFVIPEMLAFG